MLDTTLAILLFAFVVPPVLFAAQPFHAPAEPNGSIDVKLYPTENVSSGVSILVTFGIPFTRGSVTAADLAKVRVLKGGVEVPAYVEGQTPWRHLSNTAVDGQSIRIARIQIHNTFAVSYPNFETITVQWGVTNRTQNVTAFVSPDTAWHLVTSGSFLAANNVYEPDVFAVLPKEHLSKGILRTRTTPFDNGITETRDDPFVTDATEQYLGYTEYDLAAKNFFFTIINEDSPGIAAKNLNPYKTDFEPWLYDRSSAMYALYFRSGSFKSLREAVRATDFYTAHIRADGSFDLNSFDPKYSYNECMAYSYWLTGDNAPLPVIQRILLAYNAQNYQTRWTPALAMFTERNVGLKLLAYSVAYEVFGDAAYKSKVNEIIADFIWHQNGAGGQMPSPRIDGGLYHTGKQHTEGSRREFLASPWMSTLVVDATARVYGISEDPAVAHFIRRMATMIKSACRTDSLHQYDTHSGPLKYPDYLIRANGVTDMRSSTDVQHAIDVGVIAAWADYFARLLNVPDPTLAQLANDLYFTFDIGVNYWTRPDAPAYGDTAYRVQPPRKYGWEHRPTGCFAWLLLP
ncbi:MAG: hypothetical protein ACR2L2_13255 [Acidobacteriota bacterium]